MSDEQDLAPEMDYEHAGKVAYAEQRVVEFRATPTGQKFAAHPEGHYIALTRPPAPQEDGGGTPTKVEHVEIMSDSLRSAHERINDLIDLLVEKGIINDYRE